MDERHEIFKQYFDEVVVEPFDVPICGIVFWKLIYFKFKGKAKISLVPVNSRICHRYRRRVTLGRYSETGGAGAAKPRT
jgi:hypothetical protein